MIGAATVAVMRIESLRAARDPRTRLRLAGVIAVPVAAAIAIAMGRESATRDPADVVLGLTFDRFVVTSVLGFVLLQVGLVAAAGALVGASRRRREFAIYATNGAPRASLVLSAAAISALLGALGATIGVGAGLLIAAVSSHFGFAPTLTSESLRESFSFFVGCVAIAVVTSGAAGALPGWIAVRARPRDALLCADRPVGEPRTGLGAMITVAAVLSLLALLPDLPRALRAVASILAALGWLSTIPAQFGLFLRVASRLPLPWRIAARDASRMRERFAPGVAASVVSIATAIALATVSTVVDARARDRGGVAVVDSDQGTLFAILVLCAGMATVITLFSSSLASLESEADARTLTFLGADPRLVRQCAAASAGVLATIAALCAVPVGSFAAAALLMIANAPLSYRAPWLEIIALSGAVPVVAYIVKRFGPSPRPPPPR